MISITELTDTIFTNEDGEESEDNDENIYDQKNILVLFKMTNCHYCEKFENKWYNIIKSNTNNKNLKFSEVNCKGSEHEKKITNHYEITEFPTLLLIKSNNKYVKYEGLLDEKQIKQFLLDNQN